MHGFVNLACCWPGGWWRSRPGPVLEVLAPHRCTCQPIQRSSLLCCLCAACNVLFLLQVSGGVAAQGLSFSSYPGELASDDDFYMTSAQLVVLETTNHIYNFSILEVRCLVWPVRLWVCVDTCIYKVRTQWISVAWWVLETTNHI